MVYLLFFFLIVIKLVRVAKAWIGISFGTITKAAILLFERVPRSQRIIRPKRSFLILDFKKELKGNLWEFKLKNLSFTVNRISDAGFFIAAISKISVIIIFIRLFVFLLQNFHKTKTQLRKIPEHLNGLLIFFYFLN